MTDSRSWPPDSRPPWLKVKLADWDRYGKTEEVVETHGLNTVCSDLLRIRSCSHS